MPTNLGFPPTRYRVWYTAQTYHNHPAHHYLFSLKTSIHSPVNRILSSSAGAPGRAADSGPRKIQRTTSSAPHVNGLLRREEKGEICFFWKPLSHTSPPSITVLQYSTIRLIPLPPPPRPPQSQQQVGRPSPPRQAPHKAEETLELLSSNIKQGSGKTEYKQYLYQYCYTM